ncbi:hypothetical protein C4X99_05750 [Leptospira interrogans serovar Geyaweera]|nr:hypothetical protein C5473_16725 [Leptospira interrogans serovar Weerasinghe]KAA1289995.1 hypothetical protein C4X99_05750 [Leptospira interrogans serovar Geyaweera]
MLITTMEFFNNSNTGKSCKVAYKVYFSNDKSIRKVYQCNYLNKSKPLNVCAVRCYLTKYSKRLFS